MVSKSSVSVEYTTVYIKLNSNQDYFTFISHLGKSVDYSAVNYNALFYSTVTPSSYN